MLQRMAQSIRVSNLILHEVQVGSAFILASSHERTTPLAPKPIVTAVDQGGLQIDIERTRANAAAVHRTDEKPFSANPVTIYNPIFEIFRQLWQQAISEVRRSPRPSAKPSSHP